MLVERCFVSFQIPYRKVVMLFSGIFRRLMIVADNEKSCIHTYYSERYVFPKLRSVIIATRRPHNYEDLHK